MRSKLSNSRENKFYIGIIMTLCILLGVFFTSKHWMYDDSIIAQTDYNESINGLSQTTLILRSWEYNPVNNLMEVTIEREHTGTDAVEPTFAFEAKGKETKEKYPTQKVYESDNMMVVHIENVPSSYHVIGLFVTEHRDGKILKQEYLRQLDTGNEGGTTDSVKVKKSALPKPEETIIVGDYRKIEINKNLTVKSNKEYEEENIKEEMKRMKREISRMTNESIPFEDELITKLAEEIATLKEEMKYETEEEKVQSEKEIEQKENAIVSAEEEIEQYQSHVKELKEKHESRGEKLEYLLYPERVIEKERQEEQDKVEESKKQKKKQKKSKKGEKTSKDKKK